MPVARRQPYLHPAFIPRTEHGGLTRAGKRKLARPVDPKRPLHVILKSDRAKGAHSLLRSRHARPLQELMAKLAQRYHVRIISYANAGNHLHLLLQPKSRAGLRGFLRVFCGHAAQLVTRAKKGRAVGRFWTQLVYSRVVGWGRELIQVREYVTRNALEAAGVIPYKPRRRGS